VATPVAEATPEVPGAVDILFVQSFATGTFAENTASAGDYTLTLKNVLLLTNTGEITPIAA